MSFDGDNFSVDPFKMLFPVQLTGSDSVTLGVWAYDWQEQTFTPAGGFASANNLRFGSKTTGPYIVELNNKNISTPCYAWARLRGYVQGMPYYEFYAGSATGGGGGSSDGILGDTQFADGSGGFLNAGDVVAVGSWPGATPVVLFGLYSAHSKPFYSITNAGVGIQLGDDSTGLDDGTFFIQNSAGAQKFSVQINPSGNAIIKIGQSTSDSVTINAGHIALGTTTSDTITITGKGVSYSPTGSAGSGPLLQITGANAEVIAGTTTGNVVYAGNTGIGTGVAEAVFLGGLGSSSFAYIGVPTGAFSGALGIFQCDSVSYIKLATADGFAADGQLGAINAFSGFVVGGTAGGAYTLGLGSNTVGTAATSVTITLAKLTSGGTNGSMTVYGGIITAYTAPT